MPSRLRAILLATITSLALCAPVTAFAQNAEEEEIFDLTETGQQEEFTENTYWEPEDILLNQRLTGGYKWTPRSIQQYSAQQQKNQTNANRYPTIRDPSAAPPAAEEEVLPEETPEEVTEEGTPEDETFTQVPGEQTAGLPSGLSTTDLRILERVKRLQVLQMNPQNFRSSAPPLPPTGPAGYAMAAVILIAIAYTLVRAEMKRRRMKVSGM